MMTKGYIAVEPPNTTKGGLGGVAGLSMPATASLKAAFSNSPYLLSKSKVGGE